VIRKFSLTPASASRNDADGSSNEARCCAVRCALLVVLLFLSTAFAHAQFDTAEVLGTVKDPSGASISGATVVLTDLARGIKASRQTDADGNYGFANVRAGEYTLAVQAPGFEASVTDRFTVNVGARQRVDIGLRLAGDTQNVSVSGTANQLETDTSDRGQTIQATQAVTLPLNGRAYADLSKLVPGVRQSLDGTVVANPPRDASYNVNGLTSQYNNFELDGIDNNAYQEANQGFSNEAVIPSPDAVAEFKVQTDNYSAEYGRAGGAIINATTHSGTNAFHGVAYDYLRNTVLNAFGPFRGTGVKPTLVQNQFGGTFGGPVLKNRLFFFTDYEGFRSVAHILTTANLPTQAEHNGIFTSDGTTSGTPIPIKNPYTGVVYANGQVPLSDPNINPLALTAMKLMPLPNIPGAALTANNFQYLPATTDFENKGDARVDFVLTPTQNGFFRYSQRAAETFQPPNFPGLAGGNSSGTLYARTRQLAAGYNWIISPNSILELRFGQTWTESGKLPALLGQPNLMAGIPNVPQDPALGGGLNTQSVTGFSQFGTQSSALQFTNPTQANPKVNYTWVKGKHSLKVGYEYGWLAQAISDFHPKFGSDTYSGQFSSAGAATTVQAANLTDFLFGARSNYALNAPNEVNYKRFWHFGYIQDDWKALPKLTINAGLRYEFMSPYYEQNNNILNFDPVNRQLLHAGSGPDVDSTTPGHVYKLHYVGGSSLSDRALVDPDYKDFGPRFGFSYQALPGTVIRGGYGISYAYLFRFGGEGLLAYNGPNNYSATLPVNQAPSQGLCTSLTQDPTTCFRRTQDGYEDNFAGPSNFSTVRAQTRYTPKNFKNAYVQAFHLSIQQQLPRKTTLEIAYVGSHGVHIAALADYNQARLCTAAEISSGACTSSGSASLLNRRPIANFTDILTETNADFLTYNSLQTKLEHRFSDGFFLINSFTWSQAYNNSSADLEANNGDSAVVNIANIRGDRGPSGYNQPLNDTTSFIVDLPFGAGHRWGSAAPKWEQQILGGWQVTGINSVTSGVPLNLTYTANSNQVVSTTSAVYALRPNIVSTPHAVYGHSLVKTNSAVNGYLNNAAVSAPSGSQLFGNAGRNILRGPAFGQFDLSAHKNFALFTETQSLEFRIEAFNVLNSTNYISPNTNIGTVGATGVLSPNASFGTFSGSTSVFPSRQVQVALRLAF
jgi:Carboxypeptidase regulatory-like domain/TonB-dependent Receptor Plug Domain/TonB dependent receptor